MLARARIIDISRRLDATTPAWPGDATFEQHWTVPHGERPFAVSRIAFSAHLATHVDAPSHVVAGGGCADDVPLHACVGPCQVVAVSGASGAIRPADLPASFRPEAPRVLFATGSWQRDGGLPQSFPGLAPETVDLLADAGVVLVGFDSPSVDPDDADDLPAHHRCVDRGVVVIEGLDLWDAPEGRYTLVALPLRLTTADASPVRAVLLPAEDPFGADMEP